MTNAAPLASIPVTFFDSRSGLSALAIQHLRTDGRTVLVFHDAPGPAAARPLLGGIAESLNAELAAGQTLSLVETSMPEHPAETFIYARVAPSHPVVPLEVTSARLGFRGARVMSEQAVAGLCGITVRELNRTEQLAAAVHRPRCCSFPGFRQLPLGVRDAVLRAVA